MLCSGFSEYEVKKFRSPAYNRQGNAIFPHHIHGTQSVPPLYSIQIFENTVRGKYKVVHVPLSFIRGGLPEAAAASYQEDESPP